MPVHIQAEVTSLIKISTFLVGPQTLLFWGMAKMRWVNRRGVDARDGQFVLCDRGGRVMAMIYVDSEHWHHALSCWLAMADKLC